MDDQDRDRDNFIIGLRQLADFLEQNPSIKKPSSIFSAILYRGDVSINLVRVIARTLGTFEQGEDQDDLILRKGFGDDEVNLSMYFPREHVYERRVVGRQDVVAWRCPPLLITEDKT